MEAKGRARATVTRRLSTIAGFCKYAVEEELLEHSPAAHVRRPRVDYESHAVALDRNELGALLAAAGLGPPAEHALISLLALDGLRVSEAAGAGIEHLGLERGHRTLTITRRAARWSPSRWRRALPGRSTWPSASAPAARYSSQQTDGGLDRHSTGRVVRKAARRAGTGKAVTPRTLRHAYITAALDAGAPCATCKKPPRMLIREPRSGTTGPAAASTGTAPTSSPRTSRAPPGSGHHLEQVLSGGRRPLDRTLVA